MQKVICPIPKIVSLELPWSVQFEAVIMTIINERSCTSDTVLCLSICSLLTDFASAARAIVMPEKRSLI